MPTVVPPPSPSPPSQAAPAAPTAVVVDPPDLVARLAQGAQIDARIVAVDARGAVRIQTSVGTLTLQPSLPLPKEGTLVLIVQTLAPNLQVQIASLNGRPALAALRALAAEGVAGILPPAGSGAGTTAPTADSPAPVSLTVGTTVTATLLRPAAAPVAAGPQGQAPGARATAASTPPPGTTAPPPVTTTPPAPGLATNPSLGGPTTAPGPSGAPAPATAPGATAQGKVPPSPVPYAHPAPSGTAPALTAGLQTTVRILALEPPPSAGTTSPAPSPSAPGGLAAGQTLHGTVIGATALDQSVVRTSVGLLSLATRTPLPPGSTVQFQATGGLPTAILADGLPPSAREDLLLARDWPALDEALQALHDANPGIARHLVDSVVPRPDARLGASLLFFLSALRTGDVRGWLGEEPARLLQASRPELLARLRDEFGQLSRLADEPGHGDWRAVLFPFFNGVEVERIRMFMRRHRADAEADKGGSGVRFVIDVDLSRLGRVQLDGLARETDKRLDLIVRTVTPLPSGMRDDIQRIFEEANDLTGLKGALGFQAAPPNFVEVASEGEALQRPGLVV